MGGGALYNGQMAEPKRVLVPLAEGFEEIEAVTVIDVLRRAEIEVTVAGLVPGAIRGARGIEVVPDRELEGIDSESYDMVVLPGGMPGTLRLMEDERVLGAVRALHGMGRTTAAICAAPMVLESAGVVGDSELTSHPSVRDRLGRARVLGEPAVVRSGSLVTSQGVGTALEFALELVAELKGSAVAGELATAMVCGGTR